MADEETTALPFELKVPSNLMGETPDTTDPDMQLMQALRDQVAFSKESHALDRSGWTEDQWIEDAKRIMGDLHGSVDALVNGHVVALLNRVDHLKTSKDRAVLDARAQSRLWQGDASKAKEILDEQGPVIGCAILYEDRPGMWLFTTSIPFSTREEAGEHVAKTAQPGVKYRLAEMREVGRVQG